jgi:hypothetical protein
LQTFKQRERRTEFPIINFAIEKSFWLFGLGTQENIRQQALQISSAKGFNCHTLFISRIALGC